VSINATLTNLGSSVRMVTGLHAGRTGKLGSASVRGKDFLFPTASTAAVGSAQPHSPEGN